VWGRWEGVGVVVAVKGRNEWVSQAEMQAVAMQAYGMAHVAMVPSVMIYKCVLGS